LCEKARAGVEVKMIIDAMGSHRFSRSAQQSLYAAGVDFLKFNRLHPEWRLTRWFSRVFHRNHRKVMIIDEKLVFLGGVNVEAKFKTWDDLYVQISGPTPHTLLKGFAKSYVSSGGDRKKVSHFLHPKLEILRDWRERLRYVTHSPRFQKMSVIRRIYLRALSTAQESVFNYAVLCTG
jgi:cardiolipin synthase